MGLRIRPIWIPSGSLALLAVVSLVSLTAASCAWVGPAGQSKRKARTTVKRVIEVARRGPIRVLLSYRRPEAGVEAFDVFETRLQIFRFGHRLVDDRLLPLCPYCAIDPPGLGGGSSLAIRDLDGDGHPEVLVDLGLGGAHNVPYTYIYSYEHASWFSGSRTFDRMVHIWGNYADATREDLNRDGRVEFVSSDPRFSGRFGCEACTREPIQIWQFRNMRLLDVTRRFPAAIGRDLASYRACLPDRARHGRDEAPCLAAWAGDEALLGRSRLIWPVLETAHRNGNLGVWPYPHGRAYIAALRSFLHHARYLR